MNQVENSNYEVTLKTIRQWTIAQRYALLQDVLKTLAPEAEKPPVRERTLEQALRLVSTERGNSPGLACRRPGRRRLASRCAHDLRRDADRMRILQWVL